MKTTIAILLFSTAACQANSTRTLPAPIEAAADDTAGAMTAVSQDLEATGLPSEAAASGQATAAARVADTGVAVELVRIDELKKSTDKQSLAGLLRDPNERFYPLLSGGQVVSSVTVRLQGDKWKPVHIGQVDLARFVQSTRANLLGAKASDFALVEVPALHVALLMYRQGSSTRFIAYDDAGGLKPGEPLTAEVILTTLAAAEISG